MTSAARQPLELLQLVCNRARTNMGRALELNQQMATLDAQLDGIEDTLAEVCSLPACMQHHLTNRVSSVQKVASLAQAPPNLEAAVQGEIHKFRKFRQTNRQVC